MLDGLSASERIELLKACVALVDVPVDPDALNAVLRLCLRLTQDFDQAVLFTQLGGVKMLLGLTQSSNFTGFTSLTTLLIRHVMEDEATLRHTMEKVVRSATTSSNSPNTKELHYMLRTLAPAACRSPEVFVDVSRELLRVDFTLLSKRAGESEGEDQRLLLKSVPLTGNGTQQQQVAVPPLPEVSHSVICDLLNFLVQPDVSEGGIGQQPNPSSKSAGEQQQQPSARGVVRNSSCDLSAVATAATAAALQENVIGHASNALSAEPTKKEAKGSSSNKTVEEKAKSKPLLTKSVVCRLLAELVKSYGGCAKLITDHVYEAGTSELIREDTSALAFLLDELLISRTDKDVGQLVRTLVAALASCNHHSEAQAALVSEVKGALARALAWPESQIKHTKVQALANLVSTMIESCPPAAQPHPGLAAYKHQQQYNMNNMVKILLKRGIISDLARVPHSLDLSSPNVAATVNAALKPLEILTRIVNTPTAMASRASAKAAAKANSASAAGVGSAHQTNGRNSATANSAAVAAATGTAGGGGGAGTNTTNSEATRAQGDETVEPDAEATEHDVSTAAESIDPNSESQLQV